MDKRVYLIFEDNNIHGYDLEVETVNGDETKYTLKSSHNGIWAEAFRGKTLMTMRDTGNELIFTKLKDKLQYNEAVYIKLLISFSDYFSKNVSIKYTFVEQVTVLEV